MYDGNGLIPSPVEWERIYAERDRRNFVDDEDDNDTVEEGPHD